VNIIKLILVLGALGVIVGAIEHSRKKQKRDVSFFKKQSFVFYEIPNFVSDREPKRSALGELSFIERKPFIFDSMSELVLYRQLMDIFSDRYYIFPQMSYGRIIQLKRGVGKWNRNRFDKKIADFVLCDKEKAIARLVIELDGFSHRLKKKMERDEKIDMMMAEIGLPILHLKTNNLNKEYVKQEVAKKLRN